jgi:hypothetical protein
VFWVFWVDFASGLSKGMTLCWSKGIERGFFVLFGVFGVEDVGNGLCKNCCLLPKEE